MVASSKQTKKSNKCSVGSIADAGRCSKKKASQMIIALHKYGLNKVMFPKCDLVDSCRFKKWQERQDKYLKEFQYMPFLNSNGRLNESFCIKVMHNNGHRWPDLGFFVGEQAIGCGDGDSECRSFLLRVSKILSYPHADDLITLYDNKCAFLVGATERSWGRCLRGALNGDGLLCYVVLWNVLVGNLTMGELGVHDLNVVDSLWNNLKTTRLRWQLLAFRDAAHEECDLLQSSISEEEAILLDSFANSTTKRRSCPENVEILGKLVKASAVSGRACVLAALCADRMKRKNDALRLMKKAVTDHEQHVAQTHLASWNVAM